ncbi:Roundabout-like protein [Sesbania bispinosa]|nr:Roundabout-like protein [Sesbania bispinosa]
MRERKEADGSSVTTNEYALPEDIWAPRMGDKLRRLRLREKKKGVVFSWGVE